MGKIVAKFGGSSLSDAGQFVKVRQIIEMDTRRCYVVPSAPGKRFDGDEKGGKETEEARFARIREAVMTDLKHTFRPEFLNRIDEIIVFHQLTEENIRSIARRMLDTIGSRMAAQGITLQADDDAVAALAKDGFDPRYGARPLRRTLQTEVEDVVAEQMLDGKLQSGDTAHVRLKDDKVVIEK